MLLIETSHTETYDNTKAFNLARARGYAQEATVHEYHGPSDDKVSSWKLLHGWLLLW
ncbi:MAG: hypothetical protein WBG36_17380 [Ornithinimicrobium sp.]